MRRLSRLLLLAGLILGSPAWARLPAPTSLAGTITLGQWKAFDVALPGVQLSSGKPFHFIVAPPANYDPSLAYPAVVWLHPTMQGNQSYQGADPLVMANFEGGQYNTAAFQVAHPSFAIIPSADQTAGNDAINNLGGWVPDGSVGSCTHANGNTGPNSCAVNAMMTYLMGIYSIDPARLYLAGFSLGAIAVQDDLLKYNTVNGKPALFAAGYSMAGVLQGNGFGNPPTAAQIAAMKSVPLWMFGGANDHTSEQTTWNQPLCKGLGAASFSASFSETAAACGSSKVLYTLCPSCGHQDTDASGQPAWTNSSVMAWLFKQAAAATTPTPPIPGFSISQGQIIGPDGKPWLASGININDWQVGDATAGKVHKLIPGTNVLRVNVHSPFPTPASLKPLVDAMTARQTVMIFEDHDGISAPPKTGADLTAESAFYSAMAAANKDNPYVWFGTYNEPGNGSNLAAITVQEVATYNAVRNAGSNAFVLMEEPSGGNPQLVGSQAKGYDGKGPLTVAAYATMHNIIWDLHYYGWVTNGNTDPTVVKAGLMGSVANAQGILAAQSIQSADGLVPVIIGETGNSSSGDAVDANGAVVDDVVGKSGYGYIFWGWNPDPNGDQFTADGVNPTPVYGKQVQAIIAASAAARGTTPPPVVTPPAAASPDPTDIVTVGPTISDGLGNAWGLTAVGGQVSVNGTADATTSGVVELAWTKGTVWQKNTAGNWYSKGKPADAWSAATTVSPLPVVTPPVVIPPAVKTYTITITVTDGTGNKIGNPVSVPVTIAP